jgi:type IX secretion system PorP/SprF family membrane protein
VRPGIKFKYGHRGIDIAKLIFGDQLNFNGPPNTAPSAITSLFIPKTNYLDVDASLLAYHKLHWGGVTVSNLLRPNQSLVGYDSRLPIKVALFGGTRLLIKGDRMRRHEITESVTFSAMYQRQAQNDQLDLGAYWTKTPFTLGLWFRGIPVFGKQVGYEALDAVIVMFGFEIFDLRFGYSYDYTLSKLTQSATGGAHEISIVYEFNKNLKAKRKQRPMIIPCPHF